MRSYIVRAGHYRRTIHLIESILTLSLVALAFALREGIVLTFSVLMLISILSAGHELVSRIYYERMLPPRMQRICNPVKMFAAQVSVIMTYGMMIMAVGVLQIYFRRYSPMLSWSMGCYVAAGVMLLFTLWHMTVLHTTHVKSNFSNNTVGSSFRAEIKIIERIRQQPHWWRYLLTSILILLPQSLMFYTRVLFLIAKKEDGGLSCTLQEIGFAQGTIGVIAYWIGISSGRWLLSVARKRQRLFWPLTVCLGLSPLIYLIMTIEPPTTLLTLCIATFQAQLLFGFGLNATLYAVKHISGERYRNTINLLYIPLISLSMILPVGISGWLCTTLGFHTFYIIDTLSAPIAWITTWIILRQPEREITPH